MNSWWEDLEMSQELKDFHEKTVNEMEIPDWAIVDCPFCGKRLSKRSIRSIQLLFNARNIGDVAIEFCCDDCSKMDTLYFRKVCQHVEDFAFLLSPSCCNCPANEPITEEKMYDLRYNNLVEKKIFHKED